MMMHTTKVPWSSPTVAKRGTKPCLVINAQSPTYLGKRDKKRKTSVIRAERVHQAHHTELFHEQLPGFFFHVICCLLRSFRALRL